MSEPRHVALAHGLVHNKRNVNVLLGLFADAERINDRGLINADRENDKILTTAYHDICDTIEELMNAPEPSA